MLERWFFYQDAAGRWKWARLDALGTVLGHSGASFETREACVEHAVLHGYDERQESTRNDVIGLSAPARRTGPPANRPL
jgi:hypothetical protein